VNRPVTPTPKKAKRIDGEALMAIFLLALTVFLIFTVSILTLRAGTAPKPQSQKPSVTTPPQTPITPPQNQVGAIFSGGKVVPYATATDNTASIADEIDAFYAVLINLETGEIVAGKNAELIFSPASMTKVMTLIVACENLTTEDLNRQIPLSYDVVEYVTRGDYFGTELALPKDSNGISCIGDTYTIKDMLYGIGVSSAADCTYMIVKEVAGTEEAFVNMMNAKAQELGLYDTEFDNAVGFDSATNVTTARDMAQIMAYAMQCELIADILKPRTAAYNITAHWVKDGLPATYKVALKPSYASRLEKYPSFSLTGVDLEACKTGYTTESFIVTSATSKATGARYILVLGDRDNGTAESFTVKAKKTMMDMETIFNTFVP
jgi:D-alanyl-D-alanine carboxypeptidase